MAPGEIPVAHARLNAPELRDLVQDVTRTIGLVTRPFGVHFPPATDAEADAIAAPAARMLSKWPTVQKVIRKVADPVVLVGATVALFAGRSMGPRASARPSAPPPPPPRRTHEGSSDSDQRAAMAAAAQAFAAQQATQTAPPPPVVEMSIDPRSAAQLRESILETIAHADLR